MIKVIVYRFFDEIGEFFTSIAIVVLIMIPFMWYRHYELHRIFMEYLPIPNDAERRTAATFLSYSWSLLPWCSWWTPNVCSKGQNYCWLQRHWCSTCFSGRSTIARTGRLYFLSLWSYAALITDCRIYLIACGRRSMPRNPCPPFVTIIKKSKKRSKPYLIPFLP